MGNNWTEHVKRFARETGKSYGCALSDPQCSLSYKQKPPTSSDSTGSAGASEYINNVRFKKTKPKPPISFKKNKKEAAERQAMKANENKPKPPKKSFNKYDEYRRPIIR